MSRGLFFHRGRASAVHFSLSVLIALTVFCLIYAVWYPKGLFEVAGGRVLFLLIAAVDVVVGPLLTFVVYVPGKKGLAFDLAVIALLQLGFLAYGVHVLYVSRPAYLVFVKDRFELVRANEIPDEERAKARAPYADIPLTGPVVVGAKVPEDPEERTRIMFAAAAGVDLHLFPQHYVPYEQVRDDARRVGAPIERLRRLNPAFAADIDDEIRRSGLGEQGLRFLPVRAGKRDHAALIDARDASVVRIVDLRPWEFK